MKKLNNFIINKIQIKMRLQLQIPFYKYLIALCFVFIINPLYSQSVNITGTIKNSNGNFVSGVNVKLKNNPNLSTITNASGYFSLVGTITGISSLQDMGAIIFDSRGNIYFNAVNEPVRIDVYSITGQLVTTIINQSNLNGSFKICAAAETPANSNLYIAKIKIGNKITSNKFINNKQNVIKGLQEIQSRSSLKSAITTVDTLVLTLGGYVSKKVGVENYIIGLGNITMETLPASVNAPGNLTATVASSSQINLSWTDNSSNEQGFRIERAPGGTTNFVEITTVGANVSTYQNTSLSSSTSYTYRVRAYNGSSNSNYSNTSTVTTSPLNYTFTGGTLSALKAISPSLTFGTLTISGNLTIPSSESSVTLTAANLNINANISVEWPICSPYYSGPHLTINSTGTVTINSPIKLFGMSGKDEMSTSTCNRCGGISGGDLTINASTINVNSFTQVYGGNGARYYVGNAIYTGCNGGSGGKISLNSTTALTVASSGADFDFYGGSGGYGAGGGLNGSNGATGSLSFSGPSITVNEISGDLNMGIGNAQNLPNVKLTLKGSVFKGEESSHRTWSDAIYITYAGGKVDYVEDLYVVYLPSSGIIKASLSASNAFADLDLFIFNYSSLAYVGTSNGSTSNESITTNILPAGKYLIGVSYVDDCLNSVTTNYTILLNN